MNQHVGQKSKKSDDLLVLYLSQFFFDLELEVHYVGEDLFHVLLELAPLDGERYGVQVVGPTLEDYRLFGLVDDVHNVLDGSQDHLVLPVTADLVDVAKLVYQLVHVEVNRQ